MKENLVLAVGGKPIPSYIHNLLHNYDIKEDKTFNSYVRNEKYDSLIDGYKAHNELSLGKVKIEAQQKKLYKKVVFIHKDYINVEVPSTLYNFLNSDVELIPNTLYTPLYTIVDEVTKPIVVPSTKIWMCDSITHNIISTMPTSWLERDRLWFYHDEGIEYSHVYKAFKHSQFQFFNFLGSMNIRIRTI